MVKASPSFDISQRVVLIPPIFAKTDMYSVFSIFRKYKEHTFFPVLDSNSRPIGIIHEVSLKDYIYGQFGRELIKNRTLDEFVTPCSTISDTTEPDDIITSFGENPNPHGFIIVDIDGRYKGVLLFNKLLELYEENRLEINRQLLHTQKMEAIGILAGGIAHDFNNILVPILGYTELIRKQLKNEDSQKDHYLNQIREAAWRAKELVGQILTFSRQNESITVQIGLSSIIDETVKLLLASLPSTITITCNLTCTSDIVNVNPIHIHQILMNLCTNAAYAMKSKGGGYLTIELKDFTELRGWSESSDVPDGDYLDLSITDTGTGIEPYLLPRIFEPFFTTKPQGEGTGMGLSVIHGIVKSYKGFISVETKVEKGTTFHILLPIIISSDNAKKNMNIVKTTAQGNGEKILLVDDEPMILDVTSELMKSFGFEVHAFQNSKESLEFFINNPVFFDVVITDLTMPNLTGLQLAEKIRQTDSKIPIILCTGYSDRLGVTPENSSLYGLNEVLLKPLKVSQIAEAVLRQLAFLKLNAKSTR
jgi:signal transduction histidine kinase/CheY-like chemotaxis protein